MFGVVDSTGELIDLDGFFEVKLTHHGEIKQTIVPRGEKKAVEVTKEVNTPIVLRQGVDNDL